MQRSGMGGLAWACLVSSVLAACSRAGEQPPPSAPEPPAPEAAARETESTEPDQQSRAIERKMTPRLAAIYRRVSGVLREDPKFLEYAQRELQLQRSAARTAGMPEAGLANTSEQVNSIGVLAAARGSARLSARELEELARLRLKLLQRSPKMCAGFWFGGVTQRDTMLAIDASFSDDEVRRWFELSLNAARLEVHAEEPATPISAEAVSDGLQAVLESLPEEEAYALAETMQLGTNAPPEAACQALQQLIAGGLRLPEQDRAQLLLAFIFPVLVEEAETAD